MEWQKSKNTRDDGGEHIKTNKKVAKKKQELCKDEKGEENRAKMETKDDYKLT